MAKKKWLDQVHNPIYFGFVERAAQKGQDGAFRVDRPAALFFVQVVLRMVREEYENGGEDQIKKILNINGGGHGRKKNKTVTEARAEGNEESNNVPPADDEPLAV